jgi:hypothetical protein
MNKKVLSGIFALALLVAAGYGVNKSMKSDVSLSDLALANVEALAQNEGGSYTVVCHYADIANDVWSGTFMWHCQTCQYSIVTNIGNSSTCTRF